MRCVISIIISNTSTWPAEVHDFLKGNLKKFEGWECSCHTQANSSEYDSLVQEFREILRSYSLIGYHCTKLTRDEIESIRINGMSLQNADSLNARIDRLLHNKLVSHEVAQFLKDTNQANEGGRMAMLWFCFFEPFFAGEDGIGRFFRSWGGEALYNSHERNSITGAALRGIGTPCIIKANIPISSMKDSKFPDGAMVRVLLSKLDHCIRIPIKHVGYSTQNIAPHNIIDIIEYPSETFAELTKHKGWERYAI